MNKMCKVAIHKANFCQKIRNSCSRERDKIRQPRNKLQLAGSGDRWINTLTMHPYGGLMSGLLYLVISWGSGSCYGGDVMFIVVCVIRMQLRVLKG
jgi:hypothetical protein